MQQPLALLAHHDSSLIHSSCRAPGSRAAATSQTLHLSSGLGFGLGPQSNAALPGPPAPTNGGGHGGVAGSASLRRATGSLSSWSDSKLLLHPNWQATISNIPVRTLSQDCVTVFSAESQLHKKDNLRCCMLSTIIATTASALALVQAGWLSQPAAPAAGPGPARGRALGPPRCLHGT